METPEGFKKVGNHFVKINESNAIEPLILKAGNIFPSGIDIRIDILNRDPGQITVVSINGSVSQLSNNFIQIDNAQSGIYEIEILDTLNRHAKIKLYVY